MKTLLISIFLITGFGIANANHNYQFSELSVSSFDKAPISVVFDGAAFWQPNPEYSFPNVSGGTHKIKVWKWKSMGWSCAPQKVLIYTGFVNLPFSSKVSSYIDCHGNFVIGSICPIVPPGPPPVCCSWHGQYGGHCESGNGHGNDNWGGGWMMPMNPQDFHGLKMSMESKPFDNAKLIIAQQALYSNYVTSAQVAELMCLMTFEGTKLELAKIAYSRTVDKGNYYLVNNEFTFSSSIQELNQFIY